MKGCWSLSRLSKIPKGESDIYDAWMIMKRIVKNMIVGGDLDLTFHIITCSGFNKKTSERLAEYVYEVIDKM